MKLFYWSFSIVLILAALAVLAQHYRYLRTRRDVVADRQPLFHSSSVFHVATVLTLAPGQELLPAVRSFVDAAERTGGSVIYAGKVAVNALSSAQIPDSDWDAFVLMQYGSQEAYSRAASDPELQKVRASFAESYALGMRRSPWTNLGIPIMLLGVRIRDVVTRQPSGYPFRPASQTDLAQPEALARREHVVGGLLANRQYGKDAVVVLNFLKSGGKEERAANRGYGSAMMRLMAEMGNGPMHMGRAVTLEGDARFDSVAIVYYPGVEYFAELLQSEFFTGIVGGKQLGDTLSSPTVPLLPHL